MEPTLEMIFGDYKAWKIDEVTWVISFMEGSEYIYLFVGEDAALLTDTGYGIGGLRAFAEKLTDKPILVANTHYHPDHAAGNGEWERVMLSAGWTVDAPAVEAPGAGPYDLAALPHPDYEKQILHDGDRIELGGRSLRVLEALPAHCNSSLFFWDEGHRMLLLGDEFESAQTMLFDNSHNPDAPYDAALRVRNMQANARRLLEIGGGSACLLPNHNGTPISNAYLCDYIGLADAIFDGTAVIEDKLNHRYVEMDPVAPELCRVRWGSCSIFIKKAELMKIYGKRGA
jgi:glyoxylase-like metal-dependent hydrolase (beta-lactamase superfamily II)